MTGEKFEVPIIRAEHMFANRGFVGTKYFSKAVLAFRGFKFCDGLVKKLNFLEPYEKTIISNFNPKDRPPNIFSGRFKDENIIVITKLLWGGPQTAIVLEELACLGVKIVIGLGAAGSLVKKIKPNEILIAESGLCRDGTSKEYTDKNEAYANRKLLKIVKDVTISQKGIHVGTVWTTDALYREFPSKIQSMKEAGASVVNLETAPFYAVSEVLGQDAIYLAAISDYIGGESWNSWFRDLTKTDEKLYNICLKLLEYS